MTALPPPITHLVSPDLQPTPAAVTPEALPVLHERDFLRLAHLAHRCFGLDLRDGKQGLVAARLSRLVRELGLASFQQYCDYLLADRTGAALAVFADHLTTNHTSFFRESAHFDFLRETVLPALRKRPRVDIWSAGCSSGEEPYSIALSLLEYAPRIAACARIRATDISTRMLDRASAATYAADRIAPIPLPLRDRYLIPAGPHFFRIAPQVRALVEVARFNLMDPIPPTAQYSIIFCRNVMLYFDRPTHQALIQRLTAHLEPGGFLFIGHSESLNGIDHSLEPAGPAIYRRPVRPNTSFASATTASVTPFSEEKVPA
jgi:chemotaxis protein methyltransferase CheR